MANEKKIIAYKGFDKDFKCRDFQYEVGKTYEMDGNIKCCNRGFHACESPMEVFDHYDMLTSRFAAVEQSPVNTVVALDSRNSDLSEFSYFSFFYLLTLHFPYKWGLHSAEKLRTFAPENRKQRKK